MNKNIIDLEDYLENREAMPDIQSIAGERWFPEETNITEDMTKYWGGDFGVSSECNKLRAVLLHRPGKEVDNFDANVVRFRAPSILKSSESSMMCSPTTIAATGSRCSM